MNEVVTSIEEFLERLENNVHELMDTLDKGDYDHKFDVKISMNGVQLNLPIHADLYHRLTTLLQEEIEENKL